MSDIRFNRWLHQSGTGGVYQAGSGNVGIGSSVPSTTLAVNGTISATSIDVNGSISATSISSASASFSGDVSIGGTLTYEDVTNIDAVGIITAQSGIHIDDSIVHLGDTNTKIRFPAADTFTVETAGSERFRITSAGNVGINTSTFAANGTNFKVSDGTISRLALDKTGANARKFEIGNFGTGLNVYDVTADEERLRIDSSGRLLIGTGTAPTASVISDALFVLQGYVGTPTGDSLISLQRGQAPASISSGAQIGGINFGANDGSRYAQIHVNSDGASGTNDYPGRIVFSTTADGGSSPTERLRITSTGEIKQYGFTGSSDTSADDLVLGNTTGGVNRGITIWSNSSQNGSIAFADNDSNFRGAVQYLHNGDSLRFLTAGDERLRINNSGLMVFPDVTADKIQLNGTAANYYRISKLAGGGNLSDGNFKFTAGNNAAGGFTFHSGGSEKFRIDSGGDLYQRTQRVHTVLHTEYRQLSGNVSTDSSSYVDIINFGYTPKRSGSLVVCHFQVQTWNGSASNMAGDIYFRARYDQGGGSYTSVQYGGLNERMTGNLDQDNNRQHLYYTHKFGFIAQNTNQHTINLQTKNSATLSTDFNWFHTTNDGNGCWIFEYDQ